MCLNTEAADHELQINKFLKLRSLQHEKKKLPTIDYKLMHLKFKRQRLGLCPEKTQSYPGSLTPRRNQGRVSCHLLILFPLKQNRELISLTDQHMRYAGDVCSCQTHKHNKKCQKRWKKSRASVHGLQTATSISIKTNSAETLSLEPSLTDWRDVTRKTQISKAGSSSLSYQVVKNCGEDLRAKEIIFFPCGKEVWVGDL